MDRIWKTFFLIAFVSMVLTVPGWANEQKDHICFRALDADQDGLVTLAEFEKYYQDGEAKFKAADADHDGKLTHDEYHDLLGHGST